MIRLGALGICNYSLKPVHTALELITATTVAVINGRTFNKTNAGFAIVAYMYATAGYTGPILVSPFEANVTYTPVGYGDVYSEGSVVYQGKTYYYSGGATWQSGDKNDTSGLGRIKLYNYLRAPAAVELLDRYFKNGYS